MGRTNESASNSSGYQSMRKGIYEMEKDTYRLSRESRWTRVTFLSLKRQTRDMGSELKREIMERWKKTHKFWNSSQTRKNLTSTAEFLPWCGNNKWSFVQSKICMLTVTSDRQVQCHMQGINLAFCHGIRLSTGRVHRETVLGRPCQDHGMLRI